MALPNLDSPPFTFKSASIIPFLIITLFFIESLSLLNPPTTFFSIVPFSIITVLPSALPSEAIPPLTYLIFPPLTIVLLLITFTSPLSLLPVSITNICISLLFSTMSLLLLTFFDSLYPPIALLISFFVLNIFTSLSE